VKGTVRLKNRGKKMTDNDDLRLMKGHVEALEPLRAKV
jgi:hypothetical protein